MNDRDLLTTTGGRAYALIKLAQLTQSVGIRIPAFETIPARSLATWDRSERPDFVNLPSNADKLPPSLIGNWNSADSSVKSVFQMVLEVLSAEGRPPVIKCSYLADNQPHLFSFAGIGATTVPPARGGLDSLCTAAGTVLRARYSGLPVYYRIAHPSLSCLDVGLVAMKYLPGQTTWGTIWGGPAGFVCHCVKEDVIPQLYSNIAAPIETVKRACWPSWLQVRGFTELIDAVEYWCKSGNAGRHFDIEFCISKDDVLHLTQWRLLPERTGAILAATLRQEAESLPPSPFSESRIPEGFQIDSMNLPSDVRCLSERMENSADEVWVIPYQSSGADLFKVLLAGHLRPGIRLPPLVVVHRVEKAIGHLHAVAMEDPNLTVIVHRFVHDRESKSHGTRLVEQLGFNKVKNDFHRLSRPRMLRGGDTIGIISPSSPVYPDLDERWNRAVSAFEKSFSVTVVEAPTAKRRFGFLSAPGRERARDFMEMMLNPKIAGVITSYGGYNSNGLFEHIDFDALHGVNKVVLGYSDTSALLLAIHAKTGLVTFHGPALLPQFGEVPEPFEYSVNMLRSAIFKDSPMGILQPPPMWTAQYYPWNEKPRKRIMTVADKWETWIPGNAEGRLIAGNIDTINFLVGTSFFPETKGKILFLEATGAEAYLPRIERSLIHLRSTGHLCQIAGLAFARCPVTTSEGGRTLQDVVTDIVHNFSIPVVGGVDFGHTDPILTLPNGCLARLRASRNNVQITILESAVQNNL